MVTDEDKEIAKKIREGTAGVKELFDLVDREGDNNGSVSKSEFGSLLAKLDIDATTHRIDEVFSKCKGEIKAADEDLNIDEF